MLATRRYSSLLLGTLCAILALTGCGAGSRVGASTAADIPCSFERPAAPTTVNVLAYNSSAIDPFTNSMVKSCSKDNVTLRHDPIDFGGQVQKTVASLSGDQGSYDILETYSYVIPSYAAEGKLQPLDDLFEKYQEKFQLDRLNPRMLEAMSYRGKLYGLPMQAQLQVMTYRKDIFAKLGLTPPTTFDELRTVAKAIQDSGEMEHPIALPWLASGDITTAYGNAMGSQRTPWVDQQTKRPNFSSPASIASLEQMQSLLPFMDPQVTTFDQPKVQQQLFNGSAAIAIMYTGRMIDLTKVTNTRFADQFAFAPPPVVLDGGKHYGNLSVDGWSLPVNTSIDSDLLFQLIAASVGPEASTGAVPAAFPARQGIATEKNTPYAAAANDALEHVPDPQPYPYIPALTSDIAPVLAAMITGGQSIEAGTQQMQQLGERTLAKY